MSEGRILNIQRFCTHDGPGIRTVVFLKGCPLRCIWCHNPEAQSPIKEISYDREKCTECGLCAKSCASGCRVVSKIKDFNREKCTSCGKCADACLSDALRLSGKEITAKDALAEIKRDRIFYEKSGGGVTISGGEPLFQAEFTAELLKLCKQAGIHTAIETCGFSDKESLARVLSFSDLVLFDIKETDEALHKEYTGADLHTVLENLKLVSESGAPFIIRAPIIPSLNDRESHLAELKRLSAMKGCLGVEIMPYHKTGSYKYGLLDRAYKCGNIDEPEGALVDSWRKKLL